MLDVAALHVELVDVVRDDVGIALESSTITSNASMCGIGSASAELLACSSSSLASLGVAGRLRRRRALVARSSSAEPASRSPCRAARSSAQPANRKLTRDGAAQPGEQRRLLLQEAEAALEGERSAPEIDVVLAAR